MKTNLLAVALLGASLASQAQQKGLRIVPQVAFGTGLILGANDAYGVSSVKVFTAGADLRKMLSNRFGLGAGLAYGSYSSTMEWNDDSGFFHNEFTQQVLDIPLYVRWVWGNRKGFFLNLGAVNNICIKGSDKGYSTSRNKTSDFENKQTGDLFKRYSLSPFVYLGGNFTVGNTQLEIGPQVQLQGTRNFNFIPDGQYLTFSLKASVGIPLPEHKSRMQPVGSALLPD